MTLNRRDALRLMGSSAALTHRDRLDKLPLFLMHQNAPSQRFFDWADTDMPPITADSYVK